MFVRLKKAFCNYTLSSVICCDNQHDWCVFLSVIIIKMFNLGLTCWHVDLFFKKTQEAAAFPSFEDGNYLMQFLHFVVNEIRCCSVLQWELFVLLQVPGPCEPEDLIDGIIFAANYLGCTQVLSDKNPSKSVRMSQAHEAVSRIKVICLTRETVVNKHWFVFLTFRSAKKVTVRHLPGYVGKFQRNRLALCSGEMY